MNYLTTESTIDINALDFWEKIESEENRKKRVRRFDEISDAEKKLYLGLYDGAKIPKLNPGDITTGKIILISEKEIIINIDYKDNIYVDLKKSDKKIVHSMGIGDDIDVMITEVNDEPFEIKGSITELIKSKVADKLKDVFTQLTPLTAKVIELIPAGFMMDIEMDNITLNAFMPNTLAGVNRLTEKQSTELIGKSINVMLETLQQDKGVYVVSRKKYLETLIPEEIKKLKVGNSYIGTVTGSKDFGVFVEFGVDNICLTGMIHKMNLNPEHEITKIQSGMLIEFYLRDILKGNKLILTQNPRKSLWDDIRIGQVYDGIVKNVKPFGALIKLDDETKGVIQQVYIEKSSKKLSEGEKIKVKVISVIKDERKVYLNFA